MATAYLALEDKSIYQGQAFGALHQNEGEVVFNTGMTGYQEVLTDPSYCGQIVTMTYPFIGNYGVNDSDPESAHPQVPGFIVREYSQLPSNWKCQQDLDTYLKQAGIMAMCGIDTRMLTKRLRNHGTLRGRLCLAPPTEEDFAQIQRIRIDHPVQQVTCQAAYALPGQGKKRRLAGRNRKAPVRGRNPRERPGSKGPGTAAKGQGAAGKAGPSHAAGPGQKTPPGLLLTL